MSFALLATTTILSILAPIVFTLAGAVATLTTATVSRFRHFLAFVWRMWLWGSLGYIVGLVIQVTVEFGVIGYASMNAGGPSPGPWPSIPPTDRVGPMFVVFVYIGPLLCSCGGITLGGLYGLRLARRRLAQRAA